MGFFLVNGKCHVMNVILGHQRKRISKLFFWLFVCLFLFLFRLTHMETSPFPVKDCKFRPILDTHGH